LGYNSKALIDAASSPEMIQMLVNRPALGVQPHSTWARALEQSVMSMAPKGMTQVFTAMCGTCSNETAYKVRGYFYHFQHGQENHSCPEANLKFDFDDLEIGCIHVPPTTKERRCPYFHRRVVYLHEECGTRISR